MDNVENYNRLVNSSSRVIEIILIVFGLLVFVGMIVGVIAFIITASKARQKMKENIDKAINDTSKREYGDGTQHTCEYCGLLVEDEDICPHCGARQDKN